MAGSVERPSPEQSETLFRKAQQLLPGGVNSPVRAMAQVGETPRFIHRAQGCMLTDVDGQELIDYIGSWGPMIVGHAHPQVLEGVQQALERGTSFGTPSPLEVDLAQEIVDRLPAVDKIRMVNSGTEAVMSALRVARAARDRDAVIKFEGCYHGHVDALLVRAGSGVATLGLPSTPGLAPEAAAATFVARFNDLDSVGELFRRHRDRIAAIIVEPVAGNMGVVPPQPGFLEGLRQLADDGGALLIFDEVMTGFRVGPQGAAQRYGVRPDLSTFGKIIGGGLPVGAFGGGAEYMDLVAPQGPVYQAGTLSGNPLAMASGLATLRLLDTAAYQQLETMSTRLHDGLVSLLAQRGVAGVVQRVGSMLSVFFGVSEVCNFDDAAAADHQRFAAFFRAMLKRGVHLPPSGYEAWFLSLAHDEAVVDQTLQLADEALAEVC